MSSSPTDIALLCRAQRMGSETAGIFQPAEPSILPHNDTRRPTRMIQHISAVTFAGRDMARSVEFYQKLEFELRIEDDQERNKARLHYINALSAFKDLV